MMLTVLWLGCGSDPKVAEGEDIIVGAGSPGDLDGDGSPSEEDCDDQNALISPEMEEVPYDGFDNDCDPQTPDDDLDGDGFFIADDCDDTDEDINPSVEEIPYDGVDNDCNSQTPDDDLDSDGYAQEEDCNDNDEDINPAASDMICDEIDNNCNGIIDEEWNGDNYEPNNGVFNAHEGGDLDNNETLNFEGYIQYPGDIDSFSFYVDDGWGFDFGFKVELETPSTQDLGFEVKLVNETMTGYETIGNANDKGIGGDESIEVDGGFGSDAGLYVVNVYALSGASCARYYTLKITENG